MNTTEFGNFITELRKEKGLTQKDLAEQLNITDKAVSRWETGKNYPDIETFQKLASIFNISISELLECKKIESNELVNVSNEHIVREIKKNKRSKKKYLSIIAVFLVLLSISCYIALDKSGIFSGIIHHDIPCYSNDVVTILNTVEGFIEQQPKSEGELKISIGDFYLEKDKSFGFMIDFVGICENGRAFFVKAYPGDSPNNPYNCSINEYRKHHAVSPGIKIDDLKNIISQLDFTQFKNYKSYSISVSGDVEYNNTDLYSSEFQESIDKFIYKNNILQKYNEKTLTGEYIVLKIFGCDDNHSKLIAYIYCENK